MKSKPIIHDLKEMKNKEVTVRCGLTGVLTVQWSVWRRDVTCFDCLATARD